jgi:hypothetical protein
MEDYEGIEQPECRHRHDEELDEDQVGEMDPKESAPRLRGGFWRDETRYRPLRDVEPQLEQLAVDARRAPQKIGERHGADEL